MMPGPGGTPQGTRPRGGDVEGGAGTGARSMWGAGLGRGAGAGPAITDRLVALKAEFLELQDRFLLNEVKWQESERHTRQLGLQLNRLMDLPLPPAR
ncbi:unnamed protein product [Choristocarpus tenellus]